LNGLATLLLELAVYGSLEEGGVRVGFGVGKSGGLLIDGGGL